MSTFNVRPGEARARGQRDRAFVIDSWLESWFTRHAAGCLPKDIHEPAYTRMIEERILARPDTRVLVAVNPYADDPSVEIAGFIAIGTLRHRHGTTQCGAPVLFYLFVKQAYREGGCVGELLDAAGLAARSTFCCPFKFPGWESVAARHPSAKWDPLIGRFGLLAK